MKRKSNNFNLNIKINIPEWLMNILITAGIVMLAMILLPTILMRNTMNDKSEEITKVIQVAGDETVRVFRENSGVIEEIPLEEYLVGVVSNEMPANFEDEALKAQAVAARTYLISKKTNGCLNHQEADVCDSTHCQVYTSKSERISKWDESEAEKNWAKIENAVNETKGQVLTYENQIALYPQFFSTSSGKTENSEDVGWAEIPYLKSVESKGEEVAPKFESEQSFTVDDFINTINTKYENTNIKKNTLNENIEVISRSDSGSVTQIEVGDTVLEGLDFRGALGLNSSNFTYEIKNNNIVFQCKGYGHGVGMSQWGANVMAKNKNKYTEILRHYYTGIEISKLKFE